MCVVVMLSIVVVIFEVDMNEFVCWFVFYEDCYFDELSLKCIVECG